LQKRFTLPNLYPGWLDADFLTRINFGPGTNEDIIRARDALMGIHTKERHRITLLDRGVAVALHGAIFELSSHKRPFCQDWTEAMEQDEELQQRTAHYNGRITPFDYPLDDEMDPLLWCETFTVFYVWNSKYASAILGAGSRPSMAGVAADIASMVAHLARSIQPNGAVSVPPSPILYVLQNFTDPLWSIPRKRNFSRELASRGFLLDIFRIAIARRLSHQGLDSNHNDSDLVKDRSEDHWTWLERSMFPGCELLRLGRMPLSQTATDAVYGSLDDLKASFICNGPYTVALTDEPSEHLTMSDKGEIRIFWEGRGDEFFIPGQKTFMRYKKSHSSKVISSMKELTVRALRAELVYDEIVLSYSLLFTRDEGSKRIAEKLFAAKGRKVWFIDGKEIKPFRSTIGITEWNRYYLGQTPTLQHFEHFRGHFALIQKQMTEWKPQSFRDLFQPGYKDRFMWYATIFATLIAAIGIIGIVAAIIQATLAFEAYNAAMESIQLQKIQMNLTN
jgi:hypothetical protein